MFAGEIDAEVLVGEAGGDAAAGGAIEEADLDEEGFVDLFEGVLLFGEGGGEGVEADWATVVLFYDGAQEASVSPSKPWALTSSSESAACAVARSMRPEARTSA